MRGFGRRAALPENALPGFSACLECSARLTSRVLVNAAVASFRGRLEEIRHRIALAATRSGRTPTAVTLVGVVKTVPVEVVRDAVAAGLEDLAENRVQEAEGKVAAVGRGVRWHLVGHLQRNKAARAVSLFDSLQSIDGSELAAAVARHALAAGRSIRGLVQVNVTGEASKHGVAPVELEGVLEKILGLPGITIDGLMSIGPREGGLEAARRSFVATRRLRDAAAARLGVALPELSMGMSGDYEVAIEEGSTLVRVGTALFGARDGTVEGTACS